MTIANSEFETAGAAPGLAASWTSSFVSLEEEWADWTQNPGDGFTRAQEGFEAGWTGVSVQSFKGAFLGAPTDQQAAVFNSGLVATEFDGFEREWPAPFHIGLIATVTPSEAASFSGLDEESFETGWGTVAWTMPATTTAVFGAQSFDDLEAGWSNDAFSDDITSFGQTTALFGSSSPDPYDGFEDFIAPEKVSMNNVSDQFTFIVATAQPVIVNEILYVTSEGGTLPSPLEEEVRYYGTGLGGGGQSFMLKPSLTGVAISITDDGSGEQYVLRDPAQWWTRSLSV